MYAVNINGRVPVCSTRASPCDASCACRIEILCHDINVHVPHHVASRIPSYNLRLANEALRKHWGKVRRGRLHCSATTLQRSTVPFNCCAVPVPFVTVLFKAA